jgi:hypothetical protein
MYMLYRIAVIGSICLLAACASDPNDDLPESILFQFLPADIERGGIPEAFAQDLANAGIGTVVAVNDGTLAKVRLGEKYYSATGNVCRRFKSLGPDENEHAACLIRNSWRKARPIWSKQ